MDWDDFLIDTDDAAIDEMEAEEFFLSEFGEWDWFGEGE